MDLKSPMKMNIIMLKCLGLWPENNYNFDSYTMYAAISIAFWLLANNVTQVMNCLKTYDNFYEFTATFLITLSELVAVFKTYCCIKYLPTIKSLMDHLDEDIFQPKNEEQKKVMLRHLDFWKKMYQMFMVFVNMSLVFRGLFPFLDGGVKDSRLPFFAWYPFNYKISPYYELTFAYQMLSTFFITNIIVNVDTFIAALMMYIAGQCEILCLDLKYMNIHTVIINDDCTSVKDKENAKFIKNIQHHKSILSFSEQSNDFFNMIVMGQFAATISSTCMAMFQLTVTTPFTMEFYSLLTTESAFFVEILIYCWFGNEVIIKSSNISHAAYESGWINASKELKRNLVFFLTRTQRPIIMYAVNFFVLSLTTFLMILRTTYSCFALLRQINYRVEE